MSDLEDAIEMLGAGYEHPSLEIVPAAKTVQRLGKKMFERHTPAFVKISTSFKKEMAEIDEISLKVWLYIALSVNRNSGKANPGIRTIATDCHLDKDTVTRAVKRLEGYGLLVVDRDSKKYNIYEPTGYVSANKTVPPEGTVDKSVPTDAESVPTESESVPPRRGLNQRNQSNHSKGEISKIIESANKEVDVILKFAGMEPGRSWSKLPEIYHAYGKAFCAATGLIYTKSDYGNWSTAFDVWETKGHLPKHVLEAIEEIKSEGKAGQISSPRSITWKLEAMASARNARAQKVEAQPAQPTIPDSWRRFYEDKANVPS